MLATANCIACVMSAEKNDIKGLWLRNRKVKKIL